MEMHDLYTKDRVRSGKTIPRGEEVPQGYYKLSVHICLFNQKGEMLIQQRQACKQGWPNLWDITVGGSAMAGEDSRTAAERELMEELGIAHSLADARPALTVHYSCGFDDIYLAEKEPVLSALILQPEEVQAAEWASKEEILRPIANGNFIPYHTGLIELLFALRNEVSAFAGRDGEYADH